MTAHIILVHGTFAPNAPWTRPDSRFRQALAAGLAADGKAAVFHEFGWSGRNRLADRLQAADALAGLITDLRGQQPPPPVFLVGHSHGGSVIALMLKRAGDAGRIAGAIFLSTPYYSLRVDPNFQRFLTIAAANFLLYVLPFLVGVFCTWAFHSFAFYEFLRWAGASGAAAELALAAPLLTIPLGPLLFLIAWRKKYFRGRRLLAVRGRKRRFEDQETARMPPGNYLFLRASGDEAALSLSLILFLNAWLRKLSSRVSFLAVLFERCLLSLRSRAVRALAVAGFVVLHGVVMAIHVVPGPGGLGLLYDPQGLVDTAWQSLWLGQEVAYLMVFGTLGIGDAVALSVARAFGALLWLYDLLFLSNVLGFAFVFTGYLLGALGLWASGWWNLAQAMYMEVSVEPVPLGDHTIVHVDWRESVASSGLNHSVVYEDRQAISAISRWISGALATGRVPPP